MKDKEPLNADTPARFMSANNVDEVSAESFSERLVGANERSAERRQNPLL
jgi:hypothetical protein